MCSIAARISANGLEIAKHDVGVDVAQRRMKEGFGKLANDFKIEALPQADGAIVGANHEIELHRAKPAFARAVQGMSAHCACNSAAHGCNRSHVAAIRDVRSAALLVRLHEVSSNDIAVILRDENLAYEG